MLKIPLSVLAAIACVTQVLFGVSLVHAEGVEPTHRHVSYGQHPENVLNVWLAKSDEPTPVLVIIHGGGWSGGEMQETLESDFYLSQGISVVAIRYRLLGQAILPAPVMDAARAVQFVRSMAQDWNIDKERLAVTGGSAGGCTSLWLALHDDLANPDSDDPVERESTKPLCAAVVNAQTSIDPMVIREWLGDQVLQHGMIFRSVGAESAEQMLSEYERFKPLYEQFSPINHLDAGDPPIYLHYGGSGSLPTESVSHAIHHTQFGVEFNQRAQVIGAHSTLSTKEARVESTRDFLVQNLLKEN